MNWLILIGFWLIWVGAGGVLRHAVGIDPLTTDAVWWALGWAAAGTGILALRYLNG